MDRSRLTKSFMYGRIVPALGVLYGASWLLPIPNVVRSVLLVLLVVTAGLGWMAPGGEGCDADREELPTQMRPVSHVTGAADTPQDIRPGERGPGA